MAATIASLSTASPSILKPKPPTPPTITHNSYLPFTSPLILSTLSLKTAIYIRNPPPKRHKLWGANATSGDSLPSEAIPVENSEQIVSANGDGVSTIISSLLFIAFIGLSILTIGVIYIGVTDFLQKREREKFEQEEAANKKNSKKKVRVRARPAPRGFGQKIDEEEEDSQQKL
ncbi:hypothetical protein Ancab_011598 [Ancistrocladus abbreviatus]